MQIGVGPQPWACLWSPWWRARSRGQWFRRGPDLHRLRRLPASVHVTCRDRSTDAATLQQAIDSSPAGAAIEFQGGTCLLTKGLVLLGDRTYTGDSTTGTILKQDGLASYVLASQVLRGQPVDYGGPARHP